MTFRRSVTAAAVTTVVLRLPSLWTPLTADEAGGLVVARTWANGGHLYVDAFIDRPQGLLAAYRGWDALAPGAPSSVRMLAMAAGVAVVVAAAIAAQALADRWEAGVLAAWLVAVITASPAIEGYAANGELLAGAFSLSALAITATVVTGRRSAPWLLAAGVAAGLGISCKQSAVDVPVAVAAWLSLTAWRARRDHRDQHDRPIARWLGLFLVGLIAVLAGLAIHGASLGWDNYAYALVGFRLHARSAVAGGQWHRLAMTMLVALPLLGPTLALAWHRARQAGRPLRSLLTPDAGLAVTWAVVAVGGFVAGGNFHRHYWITLALPTAVLSAMVLAATLPATGPTPANGSPAARPIATNPASSLRNILLQALALPMVVSLVLIAVPRWERDPRADADAALATWVRDHQGDDPKDRLVPVCASVTYYEIAGEEPPIPYLWVDHVESARGARDQLLTLLDGPTRPRWVAQHQPASRCDPTGELQAVLDRRYHPAATVHGINVLEANP